MEANKIDKNIQEKFLNRTFTPSASAWERLSVQLDEQPKQKKFDWFYYTKIAASIVLLFTVSVYFFSDQLKEKSPKEEIVISPSNKKNNEKKNEQLINEVAIPDALVKNQEVFVKKQIINSPVIASSKKILSTKKSKVKSQLTEAIITTNIKEDRKVSRTKEKYIPEKIVSPDSKNSIKINADDLLYAVTHTPKEVKAYYAKYNTNREDVLKAIKNELKKSNIKVNPNTILAEVERNIDDEFFENTFMKSLKRRVSDIALVIANRNN